MTKPNIKKLDANYTPSEIEEKVSDFWKKNNTFKKSIEQRLESNNYTFYDGPPFITGLPHYGHLLGSIIKDVIPRYQTLKGKRVSRVWGWDCHGLPAENKVEKELGLNSKKDIEKLGVGKFIDACKDYVNNVSSEWEWYIDRIGRWVDFKNSYKTMDQDYMESVLWVFKTLYDKKLIYKGKRTSLFCPRCSTPISNFEVAMDNTYKIDTDPSVYVKFFIPALKASILVWTTTPWTLPSNSAIAINPNETYVEINHDGEHLIVAKSRLEDVFKDTSHTHVGEFAASALIGLPYKPLYSYFPSSDLDYHIYPANFVSLDDGTGSVHIAPGFGENDTILGNELGLSAFDSIDDEGKLVEAVQVAANLFFKKADASILSDLKDRGLIFKEEKIKHSYPHCHRCDTPLIYKSQVAWYVDVQSLKTRLLETNVPINWIPSHFKDGRFKLGIESAPDWCISRSRYWGAPIPVWECDSCDWRFIAGSISEIEVASGKKVKDLHRPNIDEVTIPCQKCSGTAHRVKEVLDSWIEAASMPYAQIHFPFENKNLFENSFPADFITEYTGQLRAWFYVMHVISNGLYQKHSFNNAIVTGVIQGNDGRKMSKNYGNYPDPKDSLVKYGADSLRLYLMGSPIVLGEDISISESDWQQQQKSTLNILWNSYKFFVTYASLDKWSSDKSLSVEKLSDLDTWILLRLNQMLKAMDDSLAEYKLPTAVSELKSFIDDLSTWYIRRSRDRVGPTALDDLGRNQTYTTLYLVFERLLRAASPIIPFITEYLYQHLTTEESVHLKDWPKLVDLPHIADKDNLIDSIQQIRDIVGFGHSIRKEKNIAVKQPLQSITITSKLPIKLRPQLQELLKDELNIKEVKLSVKGDDVLVVSLDTTLTPALKAEGEAREIVRSLQGARKETECNLDEQVDATIPSWPKEFEEEIKQKALIRNLTVGDKLSIIRL